MMSGQKTSDTKKNFFYTFGSDSGFPFQNGWVVIKAKSLTEAHDIFMRHFPCREPGVLNCAFYYTEEAWKRMDPENNWSGYKCYGVYSE